jgi:hypothetical protein
MQSYACLTYKTAKQSFTLLVQAACARAAKPLTLTTLFFLIFIDDSYLDKIQALFACYEWENRF